MQKKGFTLIELLVVMAIISILATITFSQYNSAQVKARDVQRKNDMNTLAKSLVFFSNDYRKLYGEIMTGPSDDLNYKFRSSAGEQLVGSDGYVYISSLPKERTVLVSDPDQTKHINQYCMLENTTTQKFAIFSNLENKNDRDCHILNIDWSASTNNQMNSANCGATYNYVLMNQNTKLSDFVSNVGLGGSSPPCN